MVGLGRGTRTVSAADKGGTVPRLGLNMKRAEAEEQEVVLVVSRLGRLAELLARGSVVNQVQPSRIGVHGESWTQQTGHRKGPS